MGEYILMAAQTKASARGVLADGVVRQGNIRMEIMDYAREVHANYIVLGMPYLPLNDNFFSAAAIRQFSRDLEQQTDAAILLVSDET
jgi:RNase H-fold protein (predicted Holliday junction resolvase)